MKLWVLFDWVSEQAVGVYSTEAKAQEFYDKQLAIDLERGQRDCSWTIEAFDLDAEPEEYHA